MVSVGELLKKEREKKGLTLRNVEKEIKIREKFLQAVENNNWIYFPSKIYIIGVIKNYARFLGLDAAKLIAFFRRDYGKKEDVQFKKSVTSTYLTPQTKKLAKLVMIFISLLFIGYFIYQLSQFLSPPKVIITSPTANTFRGEETITIIGKTAKESAITIYGERIYPTKDGTFQYVFPLKKGKNELLIEVIGANGRKTFFKKTYIKE